MMFFLEIEKEKIENRKGFPHLQRSVIGISGQKFALVLITPLMRCLGFEKLNQLWESFLELRGCWTPKSRRL